MFGQHGVRLYPDDYDYPKCDHLNSLMGKLDFFASVENEFPLWENARTIIGEAIPQSLSFTHEGLNTIVLNLSWADKLVCAAPLEEQRKMRIKINKIIDLIADYLGKSFQIFLGPTKLPEDMGRINVALINYDQACVKRGYPSICDIIRHEMGITPIAWMLH